jgi:RimJ/RimL family protein N-acetyltransferase
MELSFQDVYGEDGKADIWSLATLYSQLENRDPKVNISHLQMPSWEQHVAFVNSRLHAYWFLLIVDEPAATVDEEEPLRERICVGQIYLSRQREIGLFLQDRYQRMGLGADAVAMLMQLAQPRGPFFANIAPGNANSKAFFEKLGFRLVQHTYRVDPVFFDEPLYPGHPGLACEKAPVSEEEPRQVGSGNEHEPAPGGSIKQS